MADQPEVLDVISPEQQKAAIEALDAAVGEVERSGPRLWQAAAECQRTRAYERDDEFLDALAAGSVPHGGRSDPGRFELWVAHRYGYQKTMAGRLAQAGRVYELLPENPPANERQMRPLYPLLKLDDAGEVIPQVWTIAREKAELVHKPERVATFVKQTIEGDPLLQVQIRPTLLEEDERFERDMKRLRKLALSLLERDWDEFDRGFVQWLREEMSHRA